MKGLDKLQVRKWIVAVLLGLVPSSFAQVRERNPRPETRPLLEVRGNPVEAALTVVSDRTLRISVSPLDGNGTPVPLADEPVLVKRDWPAATFQLRSLTAEQIIKIGSFQVTVIPEPLRFVIRGADNQVVQELRVDKSTGSLNFRLGDGPILGLGQGAAQFDRRGKKISMSASHGGDRVLYGGRVPIPWLLGTEGWALFFNHPRGEIDLTGSEGHLLAPSDQSSLPIDLFVVSANRPPDLMREYALLTGFPTMPPLWTLGYQQSHRTLIDKQAVLTIASTLREKKLPCDVLIYLGTGFCPSGWNTPQPSFTFNPKVFPDPPRDLKELQSKNFKVVLHVVEPPPRLFGRVSDKPSGTPDPNEAREYWRLHQPISKFGINGWWPDEAEQLSDAARLARIRMYWDGSQLDHPNQRPYALHRTGYAGMQRYGWLWSGDVASNWETLKVQVPVGINTSLSGVPLWGTDIGGFYPTQEFTGELFVRWFQFGAFCPLFRSHGIPSYLHFPWSWNTGDFGPPELGNRPPFALPDMAELRNPRVEPICRKYLELRYRLMPYLYSLLREAHETGMPIMRALWLHYSDDPQALSRGDEYLWGRDILVAPVTEKGATTRNLYLPRGTWYDFWTQAKTEGGRQVSREVDLDVLPLYVRAGTILPLGPVKQYTGEKLDGALTLSVYPGADGQFAIYEDDGATFNFAKAEFMKIRCEWKDSTRQLALSLEKGSKMLLPPSRKIEVKIATTDQSRLIVFNGKPIKVSF